MVTLHFIVKSAWRRTFHASEILPNTSLGCTSGTAEVLRMMERACYRYYTSFIHSSSYWGQNREKDYALNGIPLGIINEEKDLGVVIGQALKVGKQCFKATSKRNQILGMIKRSFTGRSKDIIIPLYKSLVKRHNDYCVQALSSFEPSALSNMLIATVLCKLFTLYSCSRKVENLQQGCVACCILNQIHFIFHTNGHVRR